MVLHLHSRGGTTQNEFFNKIQLQIIKNKCNDGSFLFFPENITGKYPIFLILLLPYSD